MSVVLPSGDESVAQASGDGPVDAIFGAIRDILEASARAFVRAISNALEGVAIREAEEATAAGAVERTPGP